MVDNHRHQQRGYTEAEWLGAEGDPVLSERELGVITDTGEYVFGNGADNFSDLERYGGSASWVPTIEEDTTSRTLSLTDAGRIIECTNAAETIITVPANATEALPIGTVMSIYAAGVGGVDIDPEAGVIIRNLGPVVQYREVSLRKRDTDEWVQLG